MSATQVYEGPGVLPGRYAGPVKRLHSGPTPQQVQIAEERAAADQLAGRICAAAALSAQAEAEFIALIGEFDASGAIRWWVDLKSVAHWLSWTCSMAPGVAREHVRVARALSRMPSVREAFGAGRLSYSKVREVTRVVDVVDEAELCRLALTATASQLARMVRAFRTAPGTRMEQECRRAASWTTREDGMVELRAVLPAEEGAVVVAALTAARDQFGAPPAGPSAGLEAGAQPDDSAGRTDQTPPYTNADALVDVARGFLTTAPEDRSGEDRTLVVLHVSADTLAEGEADGEGAVDDGEDGAENVPAGTSGRPTIGTDPDPYDDGTVVDEAEVAAETASVPAGTSGDPVCQLAGVGPVETETARRLACDADVLGAIVNSSGDVLALGRTRRLVSRAQRRALMIRDRSCRFPGCRQDRHLQAHHRRSWLDGGPTDLANLILLCQRHHTAVHEGGMTISPRQENGHFVFAMPDGRPFQDWYGPQVLPELLTGQLRRRRDRRRELLAGVTGFADPLARSIRPGWAGERFDLHACVEALFGMRLPAEDQPAA